jgi:hypothetical protein
VWVQGGLPNGVSLLLMRSLIADVGLTSLRALDPL